MINYDSVSSSGSLIDQFHLIPRKKRGNGNGSRRTSRLINDEIRYRAPNLFARKENNCQLNSRCSEYFTVIWLSG